MPPTIHLRAAFAVLAVSSLALASPALAQSAPIATSAPTTSPGSEADEDAPAPEIVVTAQRLNAARPETLAAAARVRGVTPAALAAILVNAKRARTAADIAA